MQILKEKYELTNFFFFFFFKKGVITRSRVHPLKK